MGTHPIFESDFDCLTETMTPIPNGFNLERLVVLVRHGARTTLSQAKVLQPQEWIMKNLISIPEEVKRTSIQVKSLDGSINDPPSSKEAEYREKPLPGGGILGQLTTIGYKQAYAVGQYLRQNYGEFDLDDYYIRSTNIYRTIETSRGVLAGWRNGSEAQIDIFVEGETKKEFMYPNGELPFIGKGKHWIWIFKMTFLVAIRFIFEMILQPDGNMDSK